MYELETPKVIKAAFNIETKSQATDNGYEVINISGFASKMYDTNGKLVVDADSEIVNTAKIDLKRLKLGRMPLLFQHDQKLIVGSVLKAEYRPEGLYVEAQVVKFPDDPISSKVYHGVKSGVLNSFSIGALVKNFDVATQDSEDYLVLDESELIELSIVTVPSNAESGFRMMTGFSKSITLPKSTLKEQNPEVCNELTCAVSKAMNSSKVTKGLTLDETLGESWMKSQEFYFFLDALVITIQDNYYANRWDELPGEEAKANIISAFSAFMASKLKLEKNVELEIKGENMKSTKSTEGDNKEVVLAVSDDAAAQLVKIAADEAAKAEPVNHTGETVVADGNSATPSADDKPSATPVDESDKTREDASTDTQANPEETPKGTEVVAEVTAEPSVFTLDTVEEFIGNLNLDTVDVDSLEKLLGIAELINLAVETKIKEQLQEALNIAS